MHRHPEVQNVISVWEGVRTGRNLPLETDLWGNLSVKLRDKSFTVKNYSDWRIERSGSALHDSFGSSIVGCSIRECLKCGQEINEAMKESSLRQRPFLFEAIHFSRIGQVAVTWIFLPLRDRTSIPFANTFYVLRSFKGTIPAWHGKVPLNGIMTSSIEYLSEIEFKNSMRRSEVPAQHAGWIQRGRFLVIDGGRADTTA
jgi:hypothetical protein